MKNDHLNYFFKRRSIRRFEQIELAENVIENCIECARLAPTGKNLQPLEYILVTKKDIRKKLFSYIHWAGYLPKWNPSEDEQPMAYIIILYKNDDLSYYCYDVGIASAHIILYAEAKNIGSCILKNIEEKKIKELLEIPIDYTVDTVIALGYKMEHPIIEENNETTKYWHDEKKRLHVPKKSLTSILHKQTYQE